MQPEAFQALYKDSSGSHNTALGDSALFYNANGNSNVGLGHLAIATSTGNYNTGVGSNSVIPSGDSNSIVLGYNSMATGSNQAILGNTTTTLTGGYASSWSTLSDGRFKTGVAENVQGLDFIMKLRPVTYHIDVKGLDRFLMGNNADAYENSLSSAVAAKEKITYTGFIAQEVETAANEVGYDFSGVNVPQNKDKQNYTLSYSDFVPPIVKAVQEQQRMIDNQNKIIEEQNNKIDELEKLLRAIIVK